MSRPAFIEALERQHSGLPLPVVETHISWVVLTAEHAYKFKKPVVLPFLDYGTAEKRRADCEAELRLNRRYAPELYLEVVTVAGESAVKMRRFDEAMRLDHVCARGELTPAHLTDLARNVAAFHAAAAIAPAASRHGDPDLALAQALENFDELEKLTPAAAAPLARLRQWTKNEHGRRRPTMARRKAEGRVRECHGDLHLGNIVLLATAGQPGLRAVPFDCIEFNEDFRWIDTASEIAFTYVDLLDHGQPGLACWLLNEWLVWSGDFDALAVLRYYAVYRAMVRAKVAALSGRPEESAGYLALAEALTLPAAPQLTITFGASGSGKTTRSSALLLAARRADAASEHAGFAESRLIRLRSDVERKRLFGLAADADSGGSIYSAETGRRTYARLEDLAAAALADGWSVIVDAACLKRAERDRFHALAAGCGAGFSILACAAPPEELRRRLAARRGDASEADASVLAHQLQWLEPLGDDEV